MGFGNNGFPYGSALVSKALRFLLGEPMKNIPLTDIYEDENICFNTGTKNKQGLQGDISVDAALYARPVDDKYITHTTLDLNE